MPNKHELNDSNFEYSLLLSDVEEPVKKTRPRVVSITITVLLVIVFAAFSASVIYAFSYPNIFYGAAYGNINFGGLTYEQAKSMLAKLSGENDLAIELSYLDKKETLRLKDIDFSIDFGKMAAAAFNIGRDGSFIKRYFDAIGGLFWPRDIQASYTIDETKLEAQLNDIASKYDVTAKQPTYSVDEETITFEKGRQGCRLNIDEAKKVIKNNLLNLNFDAIDLPVAVEPVDEIDLDAIFKQFHRDPVNASIVVTGKDKYEYKDGVIGESFDLQQVKEEFANGAETVTVDIIYTQPGITLEDMKTLTFSNLLGSYESKLNPSLVNRTINVSLAAQACDGTILLPGEEFSFNKVVGPRTYERGYKDAFIYVGNEVVEGLGGGICQVSSTLYAAVLKAELEIVERKNHKFTVDYMPLGADATVYYGSTDFRFKNNTEYPVLIRAKQEGSKCIMEIWGTGQKDYTVSFESVVLSKTSYKTVYEETDQLAPGKKKLKQAGHNGYVSELYLVKKDKDGKVISRTLVSKDKYVVCNEIYQVGKNTSQSTGANVTPEPTSTPAPTPTPSPEPTQSPTATPSPADTPTAEPNTPAINPEDDLNGNGIPDWLEI